MRRGGDGCGVGDAEGECYVSGRVEDFRNVGETKKSDAGSSQAR